MPHVRSLGLGVTIPWRALRRIDVQGARTLTLNIVTSFPEGRAAREDGIPLTPRHPRDCERLVEIRPCFKAPYGARTGPDQGPNASQRSSVESYHYPVERPSSPPR